MLASLFNMQTNNQLAGGQAAVAPEQIAALHKL